MDGALALIQKAPEQHALTHGKRAWYQHKKPRMGPKRVRYRDQTTWIVISVPNGHTGHGSMTQMARPIWHFFYKKMDHVGRFQWIVDRPIPTPRTQWIVYTRSFRGCGLCMVKQDLLLDVDYVWWKIPWHPKKNTKQCCRKKIWLSLR